MPYQPVLDTVIAAIVDQSGGQLRVEDIQPDSVLHRDCYLDSLDVIDLVVAMEDKLGFTVQDGEPPSESLQTVRSLEAFIQQKLDGIPSDSRAQETAATPSAAEGRAPGGPTMTR